jgi:DNA-binding MarR family transcriptional regulator
MSPSPRADPTRKAVQTRQFTENIRHLLVGVKLLLAHALREQGLTLPQLRLLGIVEQNPGVSAAETARLCDVSPQTLQSMLTRAERELWITRGSSAHNHRIVTVSLAPAGRRVLKQGKAILARIEAELWQGTPATQIQALNTALAHPLARLGKKLDITRAASDPSLTHTVLAHAVHEPLRRK